MIPRPLANAIVILVSIVWATNFAATLFLRDFEADPTLNFVFMTIVGGALALRHNPDKKNSQEPPPPEPPEELRP